MAYFEAKGPILTSSKDMSRKNSDPGFMWEVFRDEGNIVDTLAGPQDSRFDWQAIQVGSPHVDSQKPGTIHWQLAPEPRVHNGHFPQIEDLTPQELAVGMGSMIHFLDTNPNGIVFANIGRDRDIKSAMTWPQLHIHHENGIDPPESWTPIADRPTDFEDSFRKAKRHHTGIAEEYVTAAMHVDRSINNNPAVMGHPRGASQIAETLMCPRMEGYPSGGAALTLDRAAPPVQIAEALLSVNQLVLDTHAGYTNLIQHCDRVDPESEAAQKEYPSSPIYTVLFANTTGGSVAMMTFVNTQRNGTRAGGSEILGMFPNRHPTEDAPPLDDLYYRNVLSIRASTRNSHKQHGALGHAMAAGGA